MTASHQVLLGLVAWRVFTHSYPLTALCRQARLCRRVKTNKKSTVRVLVLLLYMPEMSGEARLAFWRIIWRGRRGGVRWGYMTFVLMPFAVQQTISAENHYRQHVFPLHGSLQSFMVHWWQISPQTQALDKMVPLCIPCSFALWFNHLPCNHCSYQRGEEQVLFRVLFPFTAFYCSLHFALSRQIGLTGSRAAVSPSPFVERKKKIHQPDVTSQIRATCHCADNSRLG